MESIIITEHSKKRFIERTNPKKIDEESIKKFILRLFSYAEEIAFKKDFMVERLINNRFIKVKYYVKKNLVFVVKEEKQIKTIITIEPLLDKKLNKDYFLI